MNENTDIELIDKIRKGNESAFEELFRNYYAPLCLFACKYIDEDNAEELVQDFFARIWENRHLINIHSSVNQYLFQSVKNRCYNFIKQQKVKRSHIPQIKRELDHEEDISAYFMNHELFRKIEKSIQSLPPKRREIFRLSREEGLKYREIAEKLNISIKTVETQMGLALKHLRETLKDFKQ